MSKEAYERDWSIEEVANMSFVESYADLAAYHVVPIRAVGIKVIAVHKALPLGPVELKHYRVDDIERAAGSMSLL